MDANGEEAVDGPPARGHEGSEGLQVIAQGNLADRGVGRDGAHGSRRASRVCAHVLP